MKNLSQILFARIITASLFIAVMAGTWDAWWHGAIGRETLWEPPHLLLYASVMVAIGLGVYAWYVLRQKIWRNLALVLLLVPISAPFDEIWHRVFGVEDLSSPLIVWSPPHLALIFAIILSFFFLLPLINKEKNIEAKRLFSSLAIVGILSLLLFIAGPFYPVGPWHLIGFWGAGIVSAIYIGTLLSAQVWLSGVGAATLVGVFFILLSSLGFTEQVAPGVNIIPHDHAPSWLTVFSLLVPAVVIDLTFRLPLWLRGMIAGLLSTMIFYSFASRFFESQFQFTSMEAMIAIVSGMTGGLIAGMVISYKKS